MRPTAVYSFSTSLEGRYSTDEYIEWAKDHSYLPFLATGVYLLFLFTGERWMSSRPAFDLKKPLVVWNSGLAVFSVLCLWRCAAFLWHDFVLGDGLHDWVCQMELDNVAAFWNWLFMASKFVELGDTVFLVARKKPVLFLHWYHHVTVLLFTWISTVAAAPLGKIFMAINAAVHSIMYSYYAFSALGVRFPKLVSMSITSLQLGQMVAGIFLLSASTFYSIRDPGCRSPGGPLTLGFLIYGSYFALFLRFFYNSYLIPRKETKLS